MAPDNQADPETRGHNQPTGEPVGRQVEPNQAHTYGTTTQREGRPLPQGYDELARLLVGQGLVRYDGSSLARDAMLDSDVPSQTAAALHRPCQI